MEQIYLFLGKCTVWFFIVVIFLKLINLFWLWNVRNYTWLFQYFDFIIFKKTLENREFNKEDIDQLIKVFKNPKTRVSKGIYVKKAIKLLEEYKNTL